MSNRAWVTLATNDSYGLGALVLAHSLLRAGSEHPAVVLITPSVTDAMRERLNTVFAEVVIVDVLDSGDAAHLALLQRPELGITFTKIHCWNLTQYEKCVFLDADTLVVQNCDELFEREEISAAPDVGWPDCFNSGVFVFTPSKDTFERLIAFAQERGSFDGGDQGLLNSFFSDWARGDISKHLPFLYNVTSAAFYSYLPALKHFGQDMKIIHFIGAAKPWLQHFNFESRTVDAPDHIRGLLQLWWDIFVGQVHSQLDTAMSGVAGNLARVVPGAPHEDLDDLTRRQGWEAGNIDYMGADSFDKIWAKISQTLTKPRSSPSPPKESPPAPIEVPVQSVEVAKNVSEPVEVAKEFVVVDAPTPAVPEVPKPVPAPVVESVPSPITEPALTPITEPTPPKVAPTSVAAPVKEAVPAPVETSVVSTEAAASEDIPVPVAALESLSLETQEESKKTEIEEKKEPRVPTPAEAPKVVKTPKPEASTAEVPAAAQVLETTPEKSAEAPVATDSPPLANTPSKEEVPAVPAAKSTEEAAQETRL